MLDTTQNFEFAFETYIYDIRFLDFFLCTHLCEDETSASFLTNSNWKKKSEVNDLVHWNYLYTFKVSGSYYVTNNVHFVKIIKFDLILKEITENEDFSLKKKAASMREMIFKSKTHWNKSNQN